MIQAAHQIKPASASRLRSESEGSPSEAENLNTVTYKVASTQHEREESFRLIYQAYIDAGLMDHNETGMRVTPWHMSPSTDTFIATHGGKVIHTITLISDDERGLPLECIYGDVVENMRSKDQFVAEFSCLASQKGYFSKSGMFTTLVHLLALAAQYARYNDISKLLIAVHPRHARFYNSFFGFQQIGELREYPSVQNAPAVCSEHDFAHLDQVGYKLYDQVYGTRFDRWQLLRQPMTLTERAYFQDSAGMTNEAVPILAA